MSLLLLLKPHVVFTQSRGTVPYYAKEKKTKKKIFQELSTPVETTVEVIQSEEWLTKNKSLAKSKKLIEEIALFLKLEEDKQEKIEILKDFLRKQEWNNKFLDIIKEKKEIEKKLYAIAFKLKQQTEEEEFLFLILTEL